MSFLLHPPRSNRYIWPFGEQRIACYLIFLYLTIKLRCSYSCFPKNINKSDTIQIILAQNVMYNPRAFWIGPGLPHQQLFHGVENVSIHSFEPVTHFRHCRLKLDGHGTFYIEALHVLLQICTTCTGKRRGCRVQR